MRQVANQPLPVPCFASSVSVTTFQAKLRQKRRKETRLELERVRALEEKAEVCKRFPGSMENLVEVHALHEGWHLAPRICTHRRTWMKERH